jgi:hypothetical protein
MFPVFHYCRTIRSPRLYYSGMAMRRIGQRFELLAITPSPCIFFIRPEA